MVANIALQYVRTCAAGSTLTGFSISSHLTRSAVSSSCIKYQIQSARAHTRGRIPGEGTPINGHGRDYRFWDLRSDCIPILCLIMIWLTSSFCRKNQFVFLTLSLSHLVPEILGPKVDLLFHQNVLFNSFKAFCINFLLDLQSNWLPFSLILDLLDPSFLQNSRSDWVQFFIVCWTHLPRGHTTTNL